MGLIAKLQALAAKAMCAMGALMDAGASGGTGGTGGGDAGGFDIVTFFKNATEYLKEIGHYIMVFAGVILVIVAVIQIAKGFASGGRGQVNWVMSIACLLVGGMLIFGGWNLATSVAEIGADTLTEMGGMSGSEIGAEGGGSNYGGGEFGAAG